LIELFAAREGITPELARAIVLRVRDLIKHEITKGATFRDAECLLYEHLVLEANHLYKIL